MQIKIFLGTRRRTKLTQTSRWKYLAESVWLNYKNKCLAKTSLPLSDGCHLFHPSRVCGVVQEEIRFIILSVCQFCAPRHNTTLVAWYATSLSLEAYLLPFTTFMRRVQAEFKIMLSPDSSWSAHILQLNLCSPYPFKIRDHSFWKLDDDWYFAKTIPTKNDYFIAALLA